MRHHLMSSLPCATHYQHRPPRCRTRHTRILKQIGVCQDAAARLRKSLRKSPWKTGPQACLSRCQQPMETDAFRRNSRTSTKLSRSSTSGQIPFGWSFSISPTDTLTHCSTSGYSAVSAPGSAGAACPSVASACPPGFQDPLV